MRKGGRRERGRHVGGREEGGRITKPSHWRKCGGYFTTLNMQRMNMLEADANFKWNLRIHQGISKMLCVSPFSAEKKVKFCSSPSS